MPVVQLSHPGIEWHREWHGILKGRNSLLPWGRTRNMYREEETNSPLKHNVATITGSKANPMNSWNGALLVWRRNRISTRQLHFPFKRTPPNKSLDAFLEPVLQWFSSCPPEFSEMDHNSSSLTTGSLYYWNSTLHFLSNTQPLC